MKITEPTRLKHLAKSVRDQVVLHPSDICVEQGHNPRNYNLPENRAHLDELKASIKQNGILVPLLVRWDAGTKRAILVDGECRLTASLELLSEGFEIIGVPTIQVTGTNEADRLILAMTANTGKPLSKWEIGTAFQKLIGFGWDAPKIADKLGYSVRYVQECMDLSDAPEEVKQLLSLEAVTPSLALKHIRENGSWAGEVLRGKVAAARAKNPSAKKVTVKRERKIKGVKLSPDAASSVIKALKAGAKSEDEKISKLCTEAFEAMDAASSK